MSHEPDVEAIKKAEEEIARLKDFIEEESSKIPSSEEWDSWGEEKRRKWASRANSKQLDRMSKRR